MEDTKKYYSIDAVSQSELKLLLNSSLDDYKKLKEKYLQEEYYEDKQHFIIGNAVDTLLTTPKQFEKLFYISKISKKPSDTKIAILNATLHYIKNSSFTTLLEDCKEEVYQAMNLHLYYMNRKKDTALEDKRVLDFINDIECQEYFKELLNSSEKKIITKEVYDTIITPMVNSMKQKEELLCEVIRGKNKKKLIGVVYQEAVITEIETVKCKGLIDLLILDLADKTITIVDYKTTSKSVSDFVKTMKERRYDIQMSFYKELLLTSNPKYAGYTFKYYWIVDSTTFPGNAQIIEADETLINIGKFGQEDTNIKGWYQGLERWKKLQETNFTQEHCFINNNIPKIVWESNLINIANYNTENTQEIEY